ncbi:probable 3-hydroxyisobutyrate dehydrogenase, mitochondrial isoform X4 [Amborella trichopoda]|uniref:probable 3-hydroxyisobutyrate dehydrogenase, mitochondrial isoform X4 n=1 Tax=Amborella trichopoda TaxID=13333 RepID=UPI0009BF6DFD|nr:probable 3-hydroxyisobutyrate dehydrogenase, mitochondrial isoform X4 [Amborella trichopoda]|eukprot:XP_020518697.1 probable 3-hydroxyisobutyrate dehydrogenase, mitochondrial isoform X4 [Amborella trichopoda]
MAFSKVKVLSTFLNWSLQSPKPHCLRFFSSFIQPQLQRVGFIGLGNMGSRMVNNLINAGYEVSVHDVNSDAIEKFSKKGIHARETPFEIAESSDVIVTMLPSSSSVLDVYTGPNGLLHGGTLLRPWLLIDSSTIDPQTSRRIAAIISKHTLKEKKGSLDVPMMLDAPVSGGVVGAEAGNLTFMKSSIYRLVVQRRLTWLQSHCFLQWGNIQSIAVEVVLGPLKTWGSPQQQLRTCVSIVLGLVKLYLRIQSYAKQDMKQKTSRAYFATIILVMTRICSLFITMLRASLNDI